jgi:hypothetical protein
VIQLVRAIMTLSVGSGYLYRRPERLYLDGLDELHDSGKTLMTTLLQVVIMVHVFALGIPPDTVGADESVEVCVLVRVECCERHDQHMVKAWGSADTY